MPLVLSGGGLTATNAIFEVNLTGTVASTDALWTTPGVTNSWQVMDGTNVRAGTNFSINLMGNTAGFNTYAFGLITNSEGLALRYVAPPNNTNNGTTNALPAANGNVTVNSGTTSVGSGTTTIINFVLNKGTVTTDNPPSFVSVGSFLVTGGSITGGTNLTFYSGHYLFQATNVAQVDAVLADLGNDGSHSYAEITTNPNSPLVAPVVFKERMTYGTNGSTNTFINNAILQLGTTNGTANGSVIGTVSMTNGTLLYGFSVGMTNTNRVVGSGTIGQVGTGTLTLGNGNLLNNFSGTFSVANGTMQVTNTNSMGGGTNFTLTGGGILEFTRGVTIVTNPISVISNSLGSNSVGTIDNATGTTLFLNGPLTKAGTTLILAGGVFDVQAPISGNTGVFNSDLVVSNATVTLNQTNTYFGPTEILAKGTVINGTTDVATNTMPILGATSDAAGVTNTYDLNGYNQKILGLASTNDGTGGSINLVSNSGVGSATLTLNGSTNTTYGGVIRGQIALVRSGTGAISLTHNNTYTGGTTINSGKIVTTANASLGSGAVAMSGGSLEVRSLLNIGAFNWSGGQVALPTLTSLNGIYLNSTNALTISGASHLFNLAGAILTVGTPTKLLGATNLTTANFSTNEFSVSGVTNTYGYSLFIRNDILWIDLLGAPPVPVDPTNSIVYPNFENYAGNRNQSGVAEALNGITNYPSADQKLVLASLTALTNNPAAMQQAFNAIMPNFYQQMATLAFNSANAQNMELSQRLWGLRVAEGGGFSMSGFADNMFVQEGQGDGENKGVIDAKTDILRPGIDNHWGMFVDGNGIFAQANSANMLPGYNSESGGVTTGLTYKWNENVATGIYAGYQGTYTKSGATGSGLGVGSTLIDNAVRFGVFGSYGQKNSKGEPLGFYANALAGGGYNNYQSSRIIDYAGLNRTANSSPGAGELDTMLGGGYDLNHGNFTYGPTASLQYTYLGANGVNETGAQSLNFNSAGWNSSSMLSSLGAHAAYTWRLKKDIVVVPQISLNWQHEFMQNPYAITGTLGGNSPAFSNWSAAPIRDFLYTGVGVTVEFAKKWNTSLFYNASAGNSDLVSQNIFWSAGFKF